MITIAISNQKGGVGKTTTTLNLSAALFRAGKRVLVCDLDPQASTTEFFLSPTTPTELAKENTVLALVTTDHRIEPLLVGAEGKIQLLPSNEALGEVEAELKSKPKHQRNLARGLSNYQSDFDYCVIDCPPALNILTRNALTAADWVIVPVECELMAERTIKMILDTIDNIRATGLNPHLRMWRVLPTKYDARLLHDREMLAALKAKHGQLLYNEPVRSRSAYKDAITSKVDVNELNGAEGKFWDKLVGVLIKEVESEVKL